MQEEALILGPSHSNVGILTTASAEADRRIAAICISAGLLHHVGPHRMHVLLARQLAKSGISTLRFDLSGIGDSPVSASDLPAQELPIHEINAAIAMLESRGYRKFLLFGICSGAVHAAKVAALNPNIAGLVLVNTGSDDAQPEVDPEVEARFYLKRSLWNPGAWKNLLSGKVKLGKVLGTLTLALKKGLRPGEAGTSSIEDEFRNAIRHYVDQGTSVLMVVSDRHAQFYELYRKTFEALQGERFATLNYPQTDHLFSSLELQRDLIDRICAWSDAIDCDPPEAVSATHRQEALS